jgi:hypothetical protein
MEISKYSISMGQRPVASSHSSFTQVGSNKFLVISPPLNFSDHLSAPFSRPQSVKSYTREASFSNLVRFQVFLLIFKDNRPFWEILDTHYEPNEDFSHHKSLYLGDDLLIVTAPSFLGFYALNLNSLEWNKLANSHSVCPFPTEYPGLELIENHRDHCKIAFFSGAVKGIKNIPNHWIGEICKSELKISWHSLTPTALDNLPIYQHFYDNHKIYAFALNATKQLEFWCFDMTTQNWKNQKNSMLGEFPTTCNRFNSFFRASNHEIAILVETNLFVFHESLKFWTKIEFNFGENVSLWNAARLDNHQLLMLDAQNGFIFHLSSQKIIKESTASASLVAASNEPSMKESELLNLLQKTRDFAKNRELDLIESERKCHSMTSMIETLKLENDHLRKENQHLRENSQQVLDESATLKQEVNELNEKLLSAKELLFVLDSRDVLKEEIMKYVFDQIKSNKAFNVSVDFKYSLEKFHEALNWEESPLSRERETVLRSKLEN